MQVNSAKTIEQWLVWAFREELPKGHPVSASPWQAITSYATLGTRVDVSAGPRDGLGFVPGNPDPLAEKIGQAVRDLPRGHCVGEGRLAAMMADCAALDPLAVRASGEAPMNLPVLVIRCAVLGKPMVWDLGQPEMRPLTRPDNQWPLVFGLDDEAGLIEVRADRRGRFDPWREPRCHLVWDEPSVRQIAEARAEYTAWRDALARLADALKADLPGVAIGAPAEPWLTGAAAEPVILKSSVKVSSRVLPLEPKRAAALPPMESDIVQLQRKRKADAVAAKRKLLAKANDDAALKGFG